MSGAPGPVPLGGGPAPWEVKGLPAGIVPDDIAAAAHVLITRTHAGRVLSPGDPETAHFTSSLLYGTEYPHNRARLRRFASAATVDAPHLGRGYPGVFLPDPTRAKDVRPLAVVGPTGYVGSVWAPSGTRMRGAVDAALASGRVYATLLTVEGDKVRAHLPSGASRRPPKHG